MSESPKRLLLASAGTGKTFQLTNHFLGLLLAGVEPERILATTFTRKAAGEILERVLLRLAQAARGGKDLETLQRELRLPRLRAGDCLDLLGRLTRKLDRFQVRTIDAFFVQLGRLFALDLDLPSDWRIVEESEDHDLRAEAVQRVLARGTHAERLELLRGLQKGDAARRVHDSMLGVIASNRDVYLESTEEAWDVVRPGPGCSEAELVQARARWPEVSLPVSGSGKPNGHWVKAHAEVTRAVDAQNWKALLEKGLGSKMLEPGERFYQSKPYPEDLSEVLAVFVAHARAQVLGELAGQTSATQELLRGFEEAYDELKHDAAAYRFDDLPNAFVPRGRTVSVIEERGLDIWFRLDGQIDHLLLDEFQDTAPVQWRVLEPLAEEILADGTGERSFFCVGDVKQSIYGWRQAEPRLLANLGQRFGVLERTSMAESYRSSKVVIDTVNLLFTGVSESPVFEAAKYAPHRRAAEEFGESFERHATARRELPGAARLYELPGDATDTGSGPMVERTVERVQALLEEAPGASVCVLLRKGKWIPLLIYHLRRAGIAASGEGGNPLTDSEAVLVFCSALELADHPDHTAAAFHVATSFLGPTLGLEPDAGRDPTAEREHRRSVARALRERLAHEGIGNVAASLLPLLDDGAFSAWDRSRFAQLVDLAFGFEAHGGQARAGLRPSDFVSHLRTEKVAAPTQSRVRVMTIHASKGLEFDAVILPDLFEPIRTDTESVLHRRSDPYGLIDAVSVSPGKTLCSMDETLLALNEHTIEVQVMEALCVLYVAATRAKRCLEMLVRPFKEKSDGSLSASFQNLVRCALDRVQDEPGGAGGLIWQHPDTSATWWKGLEDAQAREGGSKQAPAEFRLSATTGLRELTLRTPSAEERSGPVSASQLLRRPGAAQRGTLVHAWLEDLEWVEGYGPGEESLLAGAEPLEPDPERRREALGFLQAALEKEPIRRALSRSEMELPDGAEVEVRAEHRFRTLLTTDEVEELWTGSIDRLVLVREDGRVSRAEVLDYKTDAVDATSIDQRAATYRPQLEAYRRVVAAQFELDPTAVRLRLVFLAPGRVVDLD